MTLAAWSPVVVREEDIATTSIRLVPALTVYEIAADGKAALWYTLVHACGLATAALAGIIPAPKKNMDRIIKQKMTLMLIAKRILVVLVCMSFLQGNGFARRILN